MSLRHRVFVTSQDSLLKSHMPRTSNAWDGDVSFVNLHFINTIKSISKQSQERGPEKLVLYVRNDLPTLHFCSILCRLTRSLLKSSVSILKRFQWTFPNDHVDSIYSQKMLRMSGRSELFAQSIPILEQKEAMVISRSLLLYQKLDITPQLLVLIIF